MCYFRQQCRKRPPDVLLQQEYDSDSCDSDENHAEIDYSDNENDEETHSSCSSFGITGRIDDEEKRHGDDDDDDDINVGNNEEELFLDNDPDGDSDSEFGFRQSYSFLLHRVTNPIVDHSKSAVTCCVCSSFVQLQRIRMDELDHHPSFQFQDDMGFFNPCKKHITCVSCIRKSLIGVSSSIIRDGGGNYPCLGDLNCQNSLHQRTTTVIHQLRELFTDSEWNEIALQVRNFRASQYTTLDYHPFLSPLICKTNVTVEILCNRIIDILNQDEPHVMCPICTVTIQKTTACYAMRHCDWEMCWMCGKVDRRLSTDHWKTCPRYDSNVFWKKYDYLCFETVCYDEDRNCTLKAHERGKLNMNHIRKVFQLYFLCASITPEMKEVIESTLKNTCPIEFQKMTALLNEYNVYKMQ